MSVLADILSHDPAAAAAAQSYALLCNRIITVHSVLQEGSITAKLQHSHRAVSLLQQRDGAALLSGLDNGSLCYWDIRAATAAPVWELEKAHNARIRAIVGLMEGTLNHHKLLLCVQFVVLYVCE